MRGTKALPTTEVEITNKHWTSLGPRDQARTQEVEKEKRSSEAGEWNSAYLYSSNPTTTTLNMRILYL